MLRLSVVYLIISLVSAHSFDGSFRNSSQFMRPNNERQHLKLLNLHPHYHCTEDIHDELVALATRCPALSVEQKEAGESRLIDVVTVRAPDAKPVSKHFFLFGEHARELISVESGLHFAKTLCGETTFILKELAAKVLQFSEFQFIVNGNPESRKKVEQGEFCLRVNPNGVDLNRNWDEKWKAGIEDENNPGKESFSEAETRLFRDLVTEYKPTSFLSIHSGRRAMYMPFASDPQRPVEHNRAKMMQVLRDVCEKHCKCPFGSAAKEHGETCRGTSFDWVYDMLEIPYSFAFEIYASGIYDVGLEEQWAQAMKPQTGAFLQVNSHLGHPLFRDVFANRPSSFVQLRVDANQAHLQTPEECFTMFNPGTREEYNKVIENWSGAYLAVAQMVAGNDGSSGSLDKSGADDKQ